MSKKYINTIVFVNPPAGVKKNDDLAPPLSLLSLAAAFQKDEIHLNILDLSLDAIPEDILLNDYADHVSRQIESFDPELVAFTSMLLNSHIALLIASILKRSNPKINIVLGGTHFGSICRDIMEQFDFVDFIISGEGDVPFYFLIQYLNGLVNQNFLFNVALRSDRGIEISCDPNYNYLLSNDIRFAFDLIDVNTYYKLNPNKVLNYETGRGCHNRCKFCYTSYQYPAGVRYKTIRQIKQELMFYEALQPQHVFMVHDNFFSNLDVAQKILAAFSEISFDFTWSCFSDLKILSPDLIHKMSETKCNSIFIGVDAVTKAACVRYGKHNYQGINGLLKILRECLTRNIKPTCAFILDIMSTRKELETTLELARIVRLEGCDISLNPLSVYRGTPLANEMGSANTWCEAKVRLLYDSTWHAQDNPLASKFPKMFPLHAVPSDKVVTLNYIGIVYILATLIKQSDLNWLRNQKWSQLWMLTERILAQSPEILKKGDRDANRDLILMHC